MNILFNIHLFPPAHCAGAEMMLVDFGKYLMAQGHIVKVIAHQQKRHYTYENMEVFPGPAIRWFGNREARLIRWADVVFTHLDMTNHTIKTARRRLIVHVIHNDIPYPNVAKADPKMNAVIYNSFWIAKKLNYNLPSTVIRPPCDTTLFKPNGQPNGSAITLINTSRAKGASTFFRLARKFKDKEFIGVRGGYGEQVCRDYPNVKILDHTPDILSVYKQTRVLLMPSGYESWGKTAREAMNLGIPVICTDTPGLRENCGDAAIYCSHKRLRPWVEAIKKLDDPQVYADQSLKVLKHAKQTDTMHELNRLDLLLDSID